MTKTPETDELRRHRMMLEERCREMGRRLKNQLPPGCGFTLLLYDYGGKGALAYISSAKREDMRKLLEEFMQKVLSE